ncbi:MAG: DMT family transporter [Gammaproteobacteria bacterium]|nr:DMT family transporter [Gammaproteobacteria bacterium]
MLPVKKAYLYTLLTILFWGGAASAFKTALSHISPVSLLSISSVISFLLISVLLISRNKTRLLFKLPAKQWLYLLILGAINPFLYYIILFEAYHRLPGQVAMSLNYLWPVMLALLSVPILKHTLSKESLFSILLSFIGAIIIASEGDISAWGTLNSTGIILVLASTVVWASYWLLSTRLKTDTTLKLFIGFLSGSLLSVIYALLNDQLFIDLDKIPWLSVMYVGIFEMGITFFIWLSALQLASNAAKLANLIYLTPFVSLMLLALVLNESIYFSTVAGLIVIIAGILTQQYWRTGRLKNQ